VTVKSIGEFQTSLNTGACAEKIFQLVGCAVFYVPANTV